MDISKNSSTWLSCTLPLGAHILVASARGKWKFPVHEYRITTSVVSFRDIKLIWLCAFEGTALFRSLPLGARILVLGLMLSKFSELASDIQLGCGLFKGTTLPSHQNKVPTLFEKTSFFLSALIFPHSLN